MLTPNFIVKLIKEDFTLNHKENTDAKRFIKTLPLEWQPHIFGGYIRDLCIGIKPKDIDIVINCSEQSRLEKYLAEQSRYHSISSCCSNYFKGFCIRFYDGSICDIWCLHNTHYYETHNYELSQRTFENLPKTTLLNTEAVLYNFNLEKLILCDDDIVDFIDAIDNKVIEPNHGFPQTYSPFYNYKINSIVNKLKLKGWTVSQKVMDYLDKYDDRHLQF